MMRKTLSKKCVAFLIGAFTLFLIVKIFTPKTDLLFSELSLSENEITEITKSLVKTEEPLVTKIEFNGFPLFFDTSSQSFFYSIVEGDQDSSNPEVSYIGYDNKVRILFEKEEISNILISKNIPIKLIAYSDTKYKEYSLKCTTLPLMSISTRNNEELESDSFENVPMHFLLFDNRKDVSGSRITSSAGEIHVRGNMARLFPKRPYRFTLLQETYGNDRREFKKGLLGMRADGDWLLYAAYNDGEKIRDVFSSNLWFSTCADNNCWGIKTGKEYRFVELFVNGNYNGLYALGFPIDATQNDLQPNEYLYKKYDGIPEWPVDLSVDDGYKGYELSASGNRIQFQASAEWKPLREYYSLFYNSLNDPEGLADLVDINNAIDIFLFYNLIQGVDNASHDIPALKNTYLAAKKVDDGYKILFIPWDMDYSWGNHWDGTAHNRTVQYGILPTENVIMAVNPVYYMLQARNEKTKSLLSERYKTLRSNLWSDENLVFMLDEYEKQIFSSGAYSRDKSRWPNGDYIHTEEGLGQFKKYVLTRLSYLDENINEILTY